MLATVLFKNVIAKNTVTKECHFTYKFFPLYRKTRAETGTVPDLIMRQTGGRERRIDVVVSANNDSVSTDSTLFANN